jgi:hypothetical protein
MKRIKNFTTFVHEAQQIALNDPSKDGETFAGVLAANKDAKEQPKGSNKGPEVSRYLQSVGLSPGLPWCMSFVYYIFDEVCKRLGKTNTVVKTGGCMNHWGEAPSDAKIPVDRVKSSPNLIRPGQIFIMSRPGKGLGHTGIVVAVDEKDRSFTSMEGNTNDQLSGEGDRVGVNKRKIDGTNLIGFIDYFKNSRTPEFEADISKAITGEASKLSPLTGSDVYPDDATVGSGIGDAPDNPGSKFMQQALTDIMSGGGATGAKPPADIKTTQDVKDVLDDLI